LYIPVERDDCRVPLISTYPPERAQMDTDTDTVYPAIVPVNRGMTGMSVKYVPFVEVPLIVVLSLNPGPFLGARCTGFYFL
jgi:hypothetical protein